MSKHYYITTPLYYVNDRPHIGHAYTTLACDVLARFKRLDGYAVKFLTGTDEHGQKVEQSAQKAGMDPQAFTDQVSQYFRDLAEQMNFSYDDFIRTTEDRHKRAATAIWEKLVANGQIYLGAYAGWYATRDEAFYAEEELVDGKAPTGAPVEWVEEPSYFFKLSGWGEKLLAWYDENPDCILPGSRRNEVTSFVKGGLKDLSVSRASFKWGIPVPGDPDHVMYVWIEALTNYITAVGYPDVDGADFKNFWPADVQMMGKDILRFHAVYWPAFLMAADLPLPKRIYAHGWWTNEGQKISKSVGNVIDPVQLIHKYGLDQVRYFLLREVSFGQDGDFSHEAMVRRMNTDLANDLGNLTQRVLSMVHKNCDGKIPEQGALTNADMALLKQAYDLLPAVRAEMDAQAFHKALALIFDLVGAANRYVDDQAPWALKKTDFSRMETVLYCLCEVIRHAGLLSQPFMPESSSKILNLLNVKEVFRNFNHVGTEGALVSGDVIATPVPVFPRFVEEEEVA